MTPFEELAARWREDAETLDDHYCDRLAKTCERHADELEAALRDWRHQELTVAEAAEESGYSAKSIRRMVRDGRIPDSRPPGSRGEIRVQRRHLPRKPAPERDEVDDAVAAHIDRVQGDS